MSTDHSLSAALFSLEQDLQDEEITMGRILHHFEDRGLCFLLFLFALPAAVPLPGFGINFIIAAPLLLLSSQMASGKKTPWLPKSLKARTITKDSLSAFVQKGMAYLLKLEHIIKPRLLYLSSNAAAPIVIGAFCLLMSLSVLIPLPLTNTVPSLGIALACIGLMSRDGLLILAGTIIGILWVTLLGAALYFLGTEGLDILKETIKEML